MSLHDDTTFTDTILTDVVVVGAGLAGLTAARLLRDAGHRVLVVDPSPLGGRGRTDRRVVPGGDALLNRGPHALYLGGPAERVLRSLGVPLAGGTAASDGRALRDGSFHVLPAGPVGLARTTLLSAKGKVAIGKLLARLGAIRADRLADVTFADWLDQLDLPADAAALVEALGRLASYANAPTLASADMVVGQLQMAVRRGVRYLDGGWQSMVDALAEGTEVVRTTAVSVRGDEHGVEVHTADGRVVRARSAIVAVAAPSAAGDLLGERFVAGPPVEAACLDLVTSRPASPTFVLGVDDPLYLSNHCPPARLAPDGMSVVHVARYLAPGEHIEPHTSRAELMALAVRAGLAPEVIVDQRHLHRMTVVGAIATARLGGLPGRPAVTAPSASRVRLAGDWVGPVGHLLDASVASAADAAAGIDRLLRADTLVRR